MRRVVSVLLVLALCLGMVTEMTGTAAAASGDEIRAAKKIISVVYDDSGSMYGDSWVYANYAMQALTALLNEQDELYITFMSDPYTAVSVNLSDISGSVETIRKWNHSSGTPMEALNTAKKKLDSISESDVTAQFWLVIMTDGAISGMSGGLQSNLNSYKGSKMSNGTALNVVYLAMGRSAATATSDVGRGLYAYSAKDDKSITATMGEIANLISGRMVADNLVQVDDKTVSFSSELPLYSISVLSQQSTAYVVQAQSSEQTLNINRNIALDSKEPFGNTSTRLYGNAAVVNLRSASGANEVIEAGTYTITFSEPVDISNLVVQYEPAIGINAVITREGVEVTDFSVLFTGDKVTIEIIPVIPGTDTPIASSSLPRDVSWSIEYLVDSVVDDSGKGTKLTGVTLKEGDNIIRGTMQIPGFAPSIFEVGFTIEQIPLNLGVQVEQPQPLSYTRKNAGDGSVEGGAVKFWITNDGARLSAAEQDALDAKLEIVSVTCDDSGVTGPWNRFGKILASCDLVRNDDGSYTLTPRNPLPFTAFLVKAGVYTAEVRVSRDNTIRAQGEFNLLASKDDWGDLPGLVIFLVISLYLLYILFIKYKFRGQTVYYEVFRLMGNGSGVEDGAQAESKVFSFLSGGLLLPTRACRVKFYGLVLEAGPDGTITVLGKSIAKQVHAYKCTNANPANLGSIVSTMRRTERKVSGQTERVADDQQLVANRPLYLQSEAGDNEIWRIYISA